MSSQIWLESIVPSFTMRNKGLGGAATKFLCSFVLYMQVTWMQACHWKGTHSQIKRITYVNGIVHGIGLIQMPDSFSSTLRITFPVGPQDWNSLGKPCLHQTLETSFCSPLLTIYSITDFFLYLDEKLYFKKCLV